MLMTVIRVSLFGSVRLVRDYGANRDLRNRSSKNMGWYDGERRKP